jgi:hypothetical protein
MDDRYLLPSHRRWYDTDGLVKQGILVKDAGRGRSTSYSLAAVDEEAPAR